jgi:dTDP-4-dehydrorhamnose reductase
MIRLLVIGKTGQLARAIAREADPAQFALRFIDRQACDLSAEPDVLRDALSDPIGKADVVLIAAAYTAVDQAERDRCTAFAVNARAPGVIAELAAAADVPLIYLSTDYVFDGQADVPYPVTAPVAPLNVYGHSKAKGEARVRRRQPRVVILRTAWVYDTTATNFLTTMLRLAKTQDTIRVVSDQIGRPTFAGDLALACLHVAKRLSLGSESAYGTFHVTNSGDPISWADFAKKIFELTQNHEVQIEPILSSDYPTAADRPAYSVLNLSEFETTFKFVLPKWERGLRRAVHPT